MYLAPEDVLHIPGLGFEGLVGYSPIAMAKNAVGMTLAWDVGGGQGGKYEVGAGTAVGFWNAVVCVSAISDEWQKI